MAEVTGSASMPGVHQATLTWQESTPGTSFNIYRSGTAGGEDYGSPLASVPAGTLTYVDNGPFTDGQVVYYTVVAVENSSMSAPSNEAQATFPTLPAPPSSLAVKTI